MGKISQIKNGWWDCCVDYVKNYRLLKTLIKTLYMHNIHYLVELENQDSSTILKLGWKEVASSGL